MDMPQPDEDVVLGLDPLDVVEHVLTAENLEFDRTEDGDLAFTLAGEWKDYELWFAWRPEADCLQLCLALGHTVAPEARHPAHELVGLVNQRLWLGHFELWDDGEIVFRHAIAVEGADRFFPAFDFMVRGAKTPAEAMAACMFETVGEA